MSSPGDDLREPEEQFAQLHFFLVAQRHRDVLLFPHSNRKEIFHTCRKMPEKTVNTKNGFVLKRKSGKI
jgi:hypothetical protein